MWKSWWITDITDSSDGAGEWGTMWHRALGFENCADNFFVISTPNIMISLNTNMTSPEQQILRILLHHQQPNKTLSEKNMLEKVNTSSIAAQYDEWHCSHKMHISMVTVLCELSYSVHLKCKCYLADGLSTHIAAYQYFRLSCQMCVQ